MNGPASGRGARETVDAEIARLAERVRQWRDEAGFTLQELAERSGVATSTIQKVESQQMVPTVAVLLKIARGLGRRASDLVSEAPPQASVVHLTPEERHPVGNRRRMTVERLSGDLLEAEIEVWRVTVQPGQGSGCDSFEYPGEELVLCEEGELTFRVGGEDYVLRPGDVLHFKASAPHAWSNAGRRPARFLVVGTVSPEFRAALHRPLSSARRPRLG